MTIEERIAGGASTLPRLISVEEAAALLAVTDTTVRNWIKKNAIPFIELPGAEQRKHYRIPLQGLLNTLAGNYNLASDLQHLDAVFGGEKSEDEGGRAQREATENRATARGGKPVEVEGDPGELFERAQVSSE